MSFYNRLQRMDTDEERTLRANVPWSAGRWCVENWEVMGNIMTAFFFIAGFGALNHYIYGWSDGNQVVAIFVASDDSMFQRVKMLLWPYTICILIYWICYANSNAEVLVGVLSLFASAASVLVPMYAYLAITGHRPSDVFEVLTFLSAVLNGLMFWTCLERSMRIRRGCPMTCASGLAVFLLLGIWIFSTYCTLMTCPGEFFVPMPLPPSQSPPPQSSANHTPSAHAHEVHNHTAVIPK